MRHLEIFYPGLRYVDTTYWRGHPITTNAVRLNPVQARCTRYNVRVPVKWETKQKRNTAKRNETKHNETKRNTTKRNKIC